MNFFNYFFQEIDRLIGTFANTLDRGGEQAIVFTILFIFFGVIIGTFGYKIFKFIIAVNSAVFFGLVAWTLLSMNRINTELTNALTAIAAIGGAIAGFYLYQVGLFLQGFFTGALLTILAVSTTGNQMDFVPMMMVIILGIAGGIFAIMLKKFFIILSSSITGGTFLASGIQFAIILSAEGNRDMIRKLSSDLSWLVSTEFVLIITIPFTIAFIITQYVLNKNKDYEIKKEFTVIERVQKRKSEI